MVTNKFELRDSRVASTIDVVTIKEDQVAVAGVIIIRALDLVDRRNIVISAWNWPGGCRKIVVTPIIIRALDLVDSRNIVISTWTAA